MDKTEWESGIEYELRFWRDWLETKGGQWPSDYLFRVDPNSALQSSIARFVPVVSESPLKILDVGAGPMTVVGKIFNGTPIMLTAVDALADVYKDLKYPPGLPLVQTQACDSEDLSSKFPRDFFDIVHSRNALDHGYDPCKAILEMLAVCRPGGVVITSHHENEAQRGKWEGFHQWNFALSQGRFLISSKTAKTDVADVVGDVAEFVYLGREGGAVDCVLKKLGCDTESKL